jgi:hypothetical protein
MEPYHGLCFTCGAYLGRGGERQCGACLEERLSGEGMPSGDPAPAPSLPRITHHQRLDASLSRWVVTHEAERRSFIGEADAKAWAASFCRPVVTAQPVVEVAP